MPDINWQELYKTATETTKLSYSPYSNFPVGAAGITKSGKIVIGCNFENASYGLTLCAECSLVSNLHTSGEWNEGNPLMAVAVVDKNGDPCAPCGRCRQLLLEAGGTGLLVNEVLLDELLPNSFKPEDLNNQ